MLIQKLKKLGNTFAYILSEYLHNRYYSTTESTIPSSIDIIEIENFLRDSGIEDGSSLIVHSSWEHLNNGKFSAVDLIKKIISIIGDDGTLSMPAFSHYNNQKNDGFFDVKRTPSAGGILTEVFRRYPGVLRSININHSVCAYGKNAKYLIEEHHKSETSWDHNSPYYKIKDLENSWIIGLGVGHRLKVATSLHCVESMLRTKNPYYRKLFENEITYTYKNTNGEFGNHTYLQRSGEIYTPKLAKYFSQDELIEKTIKGLDVYAIRAKLLINKSIELGLKGKTMYIYPIPWPWHFKN